MVTCSIKGRQGQITQEKGLTLLELIFSVSIMVLVLLSALYVIMMAHQMSEDSRGRLLALQAARSTLEVIKDTPLPNVPAINTAPLVPAALLNGAIAIATNPFPIGGVAIATVTVTVSWTGPRNRPRNLQISTMRSIY